MSNFNDLYDRVARRPLARHGCSAFRDIRRKAIQTEPDNIEDMTDAEREHTRPKPPMPLRRQKMPVPATAIA